MATGSVIEHPFTTRPKIICKRQTSTHRNVRFGTSRLPGSRLHRASNSAVDSAPYTYLNTGTCRLPGGPQHHPRALAYAGMGERRAGGARPSWEGKLPRGRGMMVRRCGTVGHSARVHGHKARRRAQGGAEHTALRSAPRGAQASWQQLGVGLLLVVLSLALRRAPHIVQSGHGGPCRCIACERRHERRRVGIADGCHDAPPHPRVLPRQQLLPTELRAHLHACTTCTQRRRLQGHRRVERSGVGCAPARSCQRRAAARQT
jgi:hypothetical protein